MTYAIQMPKKRIDCTLFFSLICSWLRGEGSLPPVQFLHRLWFKNLNRSAFGLSRACLRAQAVFQVQANMQTPVFRSH